MKEIFPPSVGWYDIVGGQINTVILVRQFWDLHTDRILTQEFEKRLAIHDEITETMAPVI